MLIRYNTNTGRLAVYQSQEEAGNQMPTYRTQAELYNSPVTTAELTYFYNSITGASLKLFKTKGDGVKRIFKVLENGYNGELSANERVNPNGDELGGPEGHVPEALGADPEPSAHGSGGSRKASRQASNAGGSGPNGAGSEANALGHDSEAADTSDEEEASEDRGEENGAPEASKEARKRGRKPSQGLIGRRFAATVESNPRRPSSSRFASLDLILAAGQNGLAYDDYVAAGGKVGDLKSNISKGLVRAID